MYTSFLFELFTIFLRLFGWHQCEFRFNSFAGWDFFKIIKLKCLLTMNFQNIFKKAGAAWNTCLRYLRWFSPIAINCDPRLQAMRLLHASLMVKSESISLIYDDWSTGTCFVGALTALNKVVVVVDVVGL